jgi:hypothetical protein
LRWQLEFEGRFSSGHLSTGSKGTSLVNCPV